MLFLFQSIHTVADGNTKFFHLFRSLCGAFVSCTCHTAGLAE